MFRWLLYLGVIGAFVYCGATINLGSRTLFGHVENVWNSDEMLEMRRDVGTTSAPMVDRLRRMTSAAADEASR